MQQSDEDDSNYSDTDYAIHMKDTDQTVDLDQTVNIRENVSTDYLRKDPHNMSMYKNSSFQQSRRGTIFDVPETPVYRNSSFHHERRATIFDNSNEEFIESDSRTNVSNYKEVLINKIRNSNSENDKECFQTDMSDKTDIISSKKRVYFNIAPSKQKKLSSKVESVKTQFTQRPKNTMNSLMGQNVDENEEYELNSTIPPNIKQSPAKPQHKFLKRNTIEDNRDNNKLQSKPDLDNPRFDNNAKQMPKGSPPQEVPSKKKAKKNKNEKEKDFKPYNDKKSFNTLIPREVFVEMQQLRQVNNQMSYEWKEISRWVKYEQNINLETNVWGRPFIGALVYQSILYLKTGLQYGTVLLNAEGPSFQDVMDEMIQDFINSGHMNKENRERLKALLLSEHAHELSNSALIRKKSSMSLAFNGSRRQSTFTDLMYSSSQRKKNISSSTAHISELDEKIINEKKMFSVSDASLEDGVCYDLSEDPQPHESLLSKRRRSTMALIKGTMNRNNKSELNLKGIALDAEAFVIMVGVVEFLDRPVMAFIRLQNSHDIDDMLEVHLKTRFIFVLLGPKNEKIDYLEIGRCIGTLMTNKSFHECAYRANDRHELIDSISSFINGNLCLVLPAGNFDEDLLMPILEWIKEKMNTKSSASSSETKIFDKYSPSQGSVKRLQTSSQSKIPIEFDPFQKTNKPFGCLINEIKYRYSYYLSDFKDALNLHCLLAFVFIFTVCFAPALTFGGILAEKTEKSFGVNEMLIATSLNGIIAGFFSGQPLIIYGCTGPFLVFEEMLYYSCRYFCIEYLASRVWVALWVLFFTVLMIALESVYIINYVTRFTEEIFAFLIASVFLADAFKKIFRIFLADPIHETTYYCNQTNFYSNQSISTDQVCLMYSNKKQITYEGVPTPNRALISLLSMICTCLIALCLKKLRRSVFFGSYIRHTLSDIGMFISIVFMVLVDYLIKQHTKIDTKKLDIPDYFDIPTDNRSSWLIHPFGNNLNLNNTDKYDAAKLLPFWVPFASIIPALLIFIVLFFEVEVTGLILHAKHRKLKKGPGFNIDLLISALMMTLNSFFGLPWLCAAPVRTLAHWASLNVYSSNYIPGEKQKLLFVREQRVTNICVHLAIGLCLLAKEALRMIPLSVLFGIFLYFGIVSLSGTQLYERIKFIFIPLKYCPNVVYARGVRPSKRNLFTIIQIIMVAILLILKSSLIAFTFPVILVMLVPFRKFILPKMFTHKELEQLDYDKDCENGGEKDLDFYELTHMPI